MEALFSDDENVISGNQANVSKASEIDTNNKKVQATNIKKKFALTYQAIQCSC